VVIGLSVINALASKKVSMAEIAIINGTVVLITFVLEYWWLLKHETRKTIVYEKINLIKPSRGVELKADLEERTGLNINRFEIGKINFLNDTAQVRIYYFAEEQELSDYNSEEER
jgi:uncharacterized membrane protein YcaP (DUF421 family)